MIDLFIKYLFKTLILFILCNVTFAQKNKSIEIGFDKPNVLGFYTISKNKKIISSSLFKSIIKINTVDKSEILLDIYPEGYEHIIKSIKLDSIKDKEVYTFKLIEKNIVLDEVVIQAKRNRFSKTGDTLNVYIDDIKTTPHSEAIELFDKIEGFDAKENGTFKALGKNIDFITIDGRRIFGGNPYLTLSNINSDMIKSLQIINKPGANTNKGVVVNIKLKDNKKNGTYGKIGLGLGTNQSFDYKGKFNKLLKNGIFSNFSEGNNITRYNLIPINDNEIVENFYLKNSIFGYLQKNENSTNFEETEENTVNGFNKFNRIGSSLTLDNSKTSQTINLFYNNENTILENNTLGLITFNDNLISSNTRTITEKRKNSFNGSYAIKMSFNKKSSLIFKVENKNENSQINKKDSTVFQDNITLIRRTLDLNSNNDFNNFKVDFGLSQKNIPKKTNRSIFLNFSVLNENVQNKINLPLFNSFQKYKNLVGKAEISQSYPVSKNVLFEHRLSYNLNNGNFINKFNDYTKNFIDQSYILIDNLSYIQKGGYILKTNIAYINLQNTLNQNKSKGILTLKNASIRFPKRPILSDFNFTYENELIFPQIKDRLVIPDSTNIYERYFNNPKLNPYFQKSLTAAYSNTNFKLFNISSNLGLVNSSNSIQTETLFKENMLYVIAYKNVQENLFGITGNTFILFKKLPKKLEMNLSHFFLNSQTITFLDDNVIRGNRILQNINIQSNFKGISNFYFKNNFNLTFISFLNTNSNIFENNTKIQFNIGENIYAKIGNRTFFGQNIPFQNILNLEISRFFFKDKINIELHGNNLLNFKNATFLSQNLNRLTQSQTSSLPRLILLKLSFFPEKWK